jgi:glycosyltransferase involved in cell wall biosynthesis
MTINSKIFFVSTLKNSIWGGSEELWYLSALEFVESGYEVHVLVYDFGYLNDKLKNLKSKGVQIHKKSRKDKLFYRLLLKFGLFNWWLNPYKVLKTINPDIIVITDGATYYTSDDNNLSKILIKYFPQKYNIICQGNSQYHIPKNRINAIELFTKAGKVFFVSDRNKEECFHQLAFNLENSLVIQNPINIEIKNIAPLPVINDFIHIALIGRLEIAEKGQDVIIKMLSKEFWKKSNCRFHIFGTGKDESYLKKLIQYYGVEELVKIEGVKDITKIWKECQVLLLPSLIEGTSLSMLEALCLGRICIVSNVGGASEWIEDGLNGFLVAWPTEELIEQKLKIALNEENNWNQISKNARESVMSKIDVNPGKSLFNYLTYS